MLGGPLVAWNRTGRPHDPFVHHAGGVEGARRVLLGGVERRGHVGQIVARTCPGEAWQAGEGAEAVNREGAGQGPRARAMPRPVRPPRVRSIQVPSRWARGTRACGAAGSRTPRHQQRAIRPCNQSSRCQHHGCHAKLATGRFEQPVCFPTRGMRGGDGPQGDDLPPQHALLAAQPCGLVEGLGHGIILTWKASAQVMRWNIGCTPWRCPR